MLYRFPHAAVLRHALVDRIVPDDLASESCRVGFEGESVVIERESAVSRTTTAALDKLGVTRDRCKLRDGVKRSSWYAALPLTRGRPRTDGPILFRLPAGKAAAWAGAIRRQGGTPYLRFDEDGQVLIHVENCPQYVVERAADHVDDAVAFMPHQPRLWVEAGYEHPFLERLVSRGATTLVAAPLEIQSIDSVPSSELPTFALPRMLNTRSLPLPADFAKIPTPLRLRRVDREEAELWVMPIESLRELAESQYMKMLERFQAAQIGDRCVLRYLPRAQRSPLRPSGAMGYRPVRGVLDLFVPDDRVLFPMLRRQILLDYVGRDRLVWLDPTPQGIVAGAIDTRAFVPVLQVVDYQAPPGVRYDYFRGRDPFPFPTFYADAPPKPKPDPERPVRTPTVSRPVEGGTAPTKRPVANRVEPVEEAPVAAISVDEARQRCRELEDAFYELDTPFDDPARDALWPQLARAYAADQRSIDADLCWINAIWARPEEAESLAAAWRKVQKSRSMSVIGRVLSAALAKKTDDSRLSKLFQELESHESRLPVRGLWLAARALTAPTKDLLGLVRFRDRVLRRLFEGLTPVENLPAFLRVARTNAGPCRAQEIIAGLPDLEKVVAVWLGKFPNNFVYTAGIFAYAYARLADRDRALHQLGLMRACSEKVAAVGVKGEPLCRQFLVDAFTARVEQALNGLPATTSLPAEILERLEGFRERVRSQKATTDSDQYSAAEYAIQTYRQMSRILEPQLRIDSFSFALEKYKTAVRDLAEVIELTDAVELKRRAQPLLEPSSPVFFKAVASIVPILPRTDEAFAIEVLDRVQKEVLTAKPDTTDRSSLATWAGQRGQLLGHAVLVAAHFAQDQRVCSLLDGFVGRIGAIEFAGRTPMIAAAFGAVMTGLTRLGLGEMLRTTIEKIEPILDATGDGHAAGRLQAQAAMAGGWLAVGEIDRGVSLLNSVRDALLSSDKTKRPDYYAYATVAEEYIAACGRLPDGIVRMQELLKKMPVDAVANTASTSNYFAIRHLTILEATVVSLVSSSGGPDAKVRGWLDLMEYQLRRRIQVDIDNAQVAYDR